jgi:hypothetical protein
MLSDLFHSVPSVATIDFQRPLIAALIAAAFPRRAKFHDGAVAFLNDTVIGLPVSNFVGGTVLRWSVGVVIPPV